MVRQEREVRTGQQYPFASGPPGAYSPPPAVSSEGRRIKIRPQIILAILILGIISGISLFQEGDQYIAVVTGCTGGIIALGMKLLDGE